MAQLHDWNIVPNNMKPISRRHHVAVKIPNSVKRNIIANRRNSTSFININSQNNNGNAADDDFVGND